jgi:hypothetical protein
MVTLIGAFLQELQAIQQMEAQMDVDKAAMEALKRRHKVDAGKKLEAAIKNG